MTWVIIASFGGVVLVFALLLIVERLLSHSTLTPSDDVSQADLAASLRRAETAARQVQEEIVRARTTLARHH